MGKKQWPVLILTLRDPTLLRRKVQSLASSTVVLPYTYMC